MKKIFLLTALIATQSYACPDLSGQYLIKMEMDIPAIQEIKQSSCNFRNIKLMSEDYKVEYVSFDWITNGEYQNGINGGDLLLGEFIDDTFHWVLKNEENQTHSEGWDYLLENGDIERVTAWKLSSGQVVTSTTILKRVEIK